VTEPNRVIHGDCLDALRAMAAASVELIYIDPPFNTGSARSHARLKTKASDIGTRAGFAGRRYEVSTGPSRSFADAFDDYTAWLEPRLVDAHRVLSATGSLYLHVDYREVHYCKVMLDGIFGRANFINEVIWAYDYGGRGRRRWPAKHDNILFYARDAGSYVFNVDDIDRTPYMAPGLVTAEKAARGKLPTDTWWHTIVPTNGSERTGYPTQKPLGVVSRIVRASSPPGGTVLDFFCGSGTTAVAAHQAGRRFIVVDSSAEAIAVTCRRLDGLGIRYEASDVAAAPGSKKKENGKPQQHRQQRD
jgi:site-specific DNA-methyltransferase (adenine-specific)